MIEWSLVEELLEVLLVCLVCMQARRLIFVSVFLSTFSFESTGVPGARDGVQ
jgi:hypothetical protein